VTPLVMVHGFMGGSAQWDPIMPELQGQTDLIAVDLPGFGSNANMPPINTIDGFADWVLKDLNARGIDKFHLLGHSMGGMIVQEMTHKAPSRIASLILYATGAQGILPGRFETIAESKRRAQVDGPQETARRIAATWFLNTDQAANYAICAGVAEQSSLAAIYSGLDAMQAWSGTDKLAEISAPTLVIWGDGDRTYAWPQIQQLWQTIPGAKLAVLPDCAHAVHLENPDIFNRILLDFIT